MEAVLNARWSRPRLAAEAGSGGVAGEFDVEAFVRGVTVDS